ncbi:TetR/AcrR family transcriptional regulator [Nocardia caishijiensis]|uniref:TetR family transcriptional regulator n=1 Tax=Nocardia caishijiensis TaxID=184756 RepID=A0ABQ6YNV0_9NOCA|nr:TetR family transcriptional regulator [Nocardia caishijiensis]KAF0847450.1 TetR family transcriptional regulator [Nocardia caishijiensis]
MKGTAIERARRAQIVRAAIDTIAESGYAGASFSAIADAAGLSSTGLISYHFARKQNLMDEVMRTILAEFTAFVAARSEHGGPAERLAAFIIANCEFVRDHRNHLVTMLRLQAAAPDPEARARQAESDRAKLADLFVRGRAAGEFREFDPDLMAGFVLSLRNGVILRAAAEPGFDLATCTTELLTTIRLATAR